MKYSVCISLLFSCFGIWAAERREQSVRPGAYFESPSVSYKLVGFGCQPIWPCFDANKAERSTRKLIVTPKSCEDEVREYNAENIALIQDKIKFFLKYKNLSAQQRQRLWDDPVLEKNFNEFQKWLAEMRKEESTPSSVERR